MYLKPFDMEEFLRSIDLTRLPEVIRPSRWRELYRGFILSPHFQPWFDYRRAKCVHHFRTTLRALRKSVSTPMLLRSSSGVELELEECRELLKQIQVVLEIELTRDEVDEAQVELVQAHLQDVEKKIVQLQEQQQQQHQQ
jgi:hypothetical protein